MHGDVISTLHRPRSRIRATLLGSAACLVAAAVPGKLSAQALQSLAILPGTFGVDGQNGPVTDYNGTTFAGSSELMSNLNAQQATRWTTPATPAGLGFLPGANSSTARSISGDGLAVVGDSSNTSNSVGTLQAFRWTMATGMVQLQPLVGSSNAQAFATNSDGSVAVGSTFSGLGPNQAVRWTTPVTPAGLGFLLGGNRSFALGVDGSGNVVAGGGTYSGGGTNFQAFMWTPGGGMTGLGFLPGSDNSAATAVSANGSVIIGTSQQTSSTNIMGFRWTSSTGMVSIGAAPVAGNNVVNPLAVNTDGSTIVGVTSNTNTGHEDAFRWNTPTGMQSIQAILAADGQNPLGWTLQVAHGVSADGTVITGSGILPGGGWVARIPVDAFAILDLAGVDHTLGSLLWGGTVINSGPAAATLSFGGDNTDTTFIGAVLDGTAKTGLTKNGTGTTTLTGANSYSGATTINAGTLAGGAANTFSANSAFTIKAGATLDLGGFNQAIGSLAGAGTVTNSGAGSPAALTTGGDNTSSVFSGVVRNGASATALTKTGTGTLTLSGLDTYTGATTVNGGTLDVEGSIASSSLTTVNANATLTGGGTVGATTISAGGSFAPGSGVPGSSMTVAGNLAFQSGALYLVQFNSTTSSFANVTGTASPGGATVQAGFTGGNSVSKRYVILSAAGGVSGAFNPLVNTNLPGGFAASLSYDTNHAYLDLSLNFAPPHLNVNQQNVANALVNFFNTTGGIPIVFGALTPAGLTQISGELPTASQQTTFDAMNLFMGLLTDPFVAGRGDPVSAGGGAAPFAAEDREALAYAANGKPRTKSERDAYAAIYRKAPIAPSFEQRWSVWAAGYGGSQTTDGNTVLGSNNTRSSIGGVAVGADYRFSPNTLAGFAVAGGGTNFSVNGLGSGRSDLFQAGAFIRHTVGPAYISAALAYGWQDITTDRTVTVAGTDLLRANFNANAYSGRLEGGYRFVTPWLGGIGLTPYAAGQFTTFDLPAYAEQAIAGANTFALSYMAKNVTDTRSELGVRTDKSFAVQNGIFTLRGRAAWAHDFNPDRNIGATFQTLPGASFVVNGAAHAADSALVTASAEMKWLNGISLAGTFEGEFSNVTTSYAGKGVVRYAW